MKKISQCHSGKDFIQFALSRGANVRNGHGSHRIVYRNGHSVPVPVHGNHDLPKGLRCALIKQFLVLGISILFLVPAAVLYLAVR